jgi:hypothetical protein
MYVHGGDKLGGKTNCEHSEVNIYVHGGDKLEGKTHCEHSEVNIHVRKWGQNWHFTRKRVIRILPPQACDILPDRRNPAMAKQPPKMPWMALD